MNVKKIVSVLLFVISIAMIGSGVYLMNSSKYMFETAMNSIFKYLVTGYVDTVNNSLVPSDLNKYKLTTQTGLKQGKEEIASLNGDVYINSIDKKAYLNLDTKFAGEDFIGIEGLITDDKVYAKLKEVMEDFYYTALNISDSIDTSELDNFDYSQLIKLSKDDLNLLSKHFKNSVLSNIKDGDLTKTSQVLNLDNKNYKTTKISLNISEKDLGAIAESLLTYIKNDNKALQILQRFDKTITKDTIQKALDSINDAKSSFEGEDALTIAFYVEGFGTLKRIELATLNNDVDGVANNNVTITLDMYKNTYKNKTYLLTMVVNDNQKIILKEEYVSNTKANIVIKADQYEINGTISTTNNAEELNLNILMDGKMVGTVNYKYTQITKNSEYKIDLSVSISKEEITVVSNNTLVLNENIPDVDISKAKDVDEMTEEEKEKLETYYTEKFEQLGLSSFDDEWENSSLS